MNQGSEPSGSSAGRRSEPGSLATARITNRRKKVRIASQRNACACDPEGILTECELTPEAGAPRQPVFHRAGLPGQAVGSRARITLTPMAQAPVLPRGFELPLKQRLPRVGSIDQVGVEVRAAELAKRSIKKDAKVWALELALRCCDLTTLEGQDTPGKVAALCSKAIRPDPSDPNVPSVAAVCVYPNLVPTAKERLKGSGVKVASVATAFPSGQSPLDVKVRDVEDAVAMGADEIDMVIDRGAFLSGRYAKVYDEIVRVKDACGEAHLKVILEVAELGTYDNVRRASLLAMAAGGDFIKTSTGKLPGAATLPVQLVMLEAIRDVYEETGRRVGMKPAGGIRTSKNAIQYLVQVHETLGPDWLTPDLYRIGASSLVNDILMQLRKEKTGAYQSKDYFTND
jgi:deoxyribose-phosphate aldolase